MASKGNRNSSPSTATAQKKGAASRSVAPRKPVSVAAPEPQARKREITREMIAARAYELWKMRGGDAEQNWLEAEQMLRSGM